MGFIEQRLLKLELGRRDCIPPPKYIQTPSSCGPAMTDGVVYLTVLLAKTLGGQAIGVHPRILPTLSEVVYRESTSTPVPTHCPATAQPDPKALERQKVRNGPRKPVKVLSRGKVTLA
jgi:hypothetical protein